MEKKLLNRIIAFVVVCLCVISVNAQEYCFSSYHIYTNDDDKYLTQNEQNDSSKVCIDEANHEIEFSLYNQETKKWMSFALKVNSKIDLGFKAKIGTLYICTNNADQTCGVCVCHTEDGVFIDLHDFFVSDRPLSCWVKSNRE